jgi:thiol-disulfide isomerase/thioredoxin
MRAPQLLLAATVVAVGAAIATSAKHQRTKPQMMNDAVQRPVDGELASLGSATEWLNSPPLTAADLRGKVVLIDFGTYTCINWLRTLPHIRAWAEKYRDRGLVVIGVHAPEFAFEKNQDNVRREVKALNLGFPVAVDNEHAIWRAFHNQYWPALFFVDAKGRVRHHQFGEGEYAQAEKLIQQLLTEAGAKGVSRDLVSVEGRGAEAPADFANVKSPENYLGYERTQRFASPGGAVQDERRVYAAPTQLRLNEWALSGDWTMTKEAIALNSAKGRIVVRFHARDVNLVMGPTTRGTSVRFRVRIDGHAPGVSHGVDVDADGNGTVTEQRMYQLIRQVQPSDDRVFEIEFIDPGAEAFAFTFG